MGIQHIRAFLESWFNFPKEKIFCQVSTVRDGRPHIRTMGLYDFTEDGSLIFLTETSTNKWIDIEECPNITVCLLNLEYGQMIVEGMALLQTKINNLPMVSNYWENYLDEYWRNFYLSTNQESINSGNRIPLSFGVIKIKPYSLGNSGN